MVTEEPAVAAMDAASSSLLARLHPSLYMSRHLAHSSRPWSSRPPLEFPKVSVNLGPISSARSSSNRPSWVPSPSALARYGSTTVICNITASIVYPIEAPASVSSPSCSTLVPSLNLTPLSSPSSDFKSGAPSNFAQFTTERLFQFLDSSMPFDPKVLDIAPDEDDLELENGQRFKAKWCLFADCSVIGYDGALLEASMLAIMAALRQVWLPKASFSLDENVIVASPSDYWSLADQMDRIPLSFGFGIYDGTLLAAPSSFEAELCPTRLLLNLAYEASLEAAGPPHLSALHSTGPLRANNVGPQAKGRSDEPAEDEEVIESCAELAARKGKSIVAMLLEKEKAILSERSEGRQ